MTTNNATTNNRFSNLLGKVNDKTPEIQKKNSNSNHYPNSKLNTNTNKLNAFKSDREELKQNNILMGRKRYEDRLKEEQINRRLFMEEKIKKAKEDEIKKLTSVDAFPELKSLKTDVTKNDNSNEVKTKVESNNYINRILKFQDDESNICNLEKEEKTDEYVRPGCVCIQLDKATNTEIWRYCEKNQQNEKEEDEIEEEDPYIVFGRLTEMWNNRRLDYINKWGMEDYENTFMFSNYEILVDEF
jgi:hypothetical protein